MKPLPPDDLPIVTFSVAEIAAAKRDGYLHIHDNGVLTIHRPGEPVAQVLIPPKDRRRKKLTCSDLCDKTWETQGCPSGTCALIRKRRSAYKELEFDHSPKDVPHGSSSQEN
jgi:hypothetical protein